ncbi:hypothetical protein HYW18_00335 [Candidatus Uhrbacteria bacterium]|nr:hypothetical protein [Candidatus Uhrbacteria bacterium]
MFNTPLRQLKELKKARLSLDRRAAVRENVKAFMAANPVRDAEAFRHIGQMRPSIFYLLHFKPMIAIILALAILAGGGASAAAQGALPGDALYPVKTEVNERVRVWFAGDTEARAHVEAALAERRLEEAEKLSVRADIGADAEERIEANFDAFAKRVADRAARLEADGNAGAAAAVTARFEAALEAHSDILARLKEAQEAQIDEDDDDAAVLGKIRVRVENRREDAGEARARVEAKLRATVENAPDIEAAARGRRQVVENKIREVSLMLERVGGRVSAETAAQAAAKVEAAKALLAKGDASVEAEAYAQAIADYTNAHIEAQNAQRLIVANMELGISAILGATVRADRGDEEEKSDEKNQAQKEDEDRDEDKEEVNEVEAEVDVGADTSVGNVRANINAGASVNLR